MPAVIWLPAASIDIGRLYDFLAKHNPIAAMRATRVIEGAADLLVTSPKLGRLIEGEDNLRELQAPFGAAAYVLRYRLAADGTPVIIRVWHSRENRFPSEQEIP